MFKVLFFLKEKFLKCALACLHFGALAC